MLDQLRLVARNRWRLVSVVAIASGLAFVVAYLADTLGEATLRLPGVVVDEQTTSHPEFHRFETRTVSTTQCQISITGRTFWWEASFGIGSRVAVHVVEGRFSGWRYISDVESPASAAFHDAIDNYNDTADRIRDDVRLPRGDASTR